MAKKRILYILSLTVAAFIIFPFFLTSAGADTPLPSIYLNDEVWYLDARLPAYIEDDAFYLPYSALGKLDKVTLRYDEYSNSALYIYEDRYYSVCFTNGAAFSPSGESVCKIIKMNDEYYIEAETVCASLGLRTEYYDYGKSAAIRITDGSETLRLATLIEIFTQNGAPYIERMSAAPGMLPEYPVFIGVIISSDEEYQSLYENSLTRNEKIMIFYEAVYFLSLDDSSAFNYLINAAANGSSVGFYTDSEDFGFAFSVTKEAAGKAYRLTKSFYRGVYIPECPEYAEEELTNYGYILYSLDNAAGFYDFDTLIEHTESQLGSDRLACLLFQGETASLLKDFIDYAKVSQRYEICGSYLIFPHK